MKLLDNYERSTGITERVTPEELTEINLFLDAVQETQVMKVCSDIQAFLIYNMHHLHQANVCRASQTPKVSHRTKNTSLCFFLFCCSFMVWGCSCLFLSLQELNTDFRGVRVKNKQLEHLCAAVECKVGLHDVPKEDRWKYLDIQYLICKTLGSDEILDSSFFRGEVNKCNV